MSNDTQQLTLDLGHRFSHCGEAPVGAPYAKGSDTSRAAAVKVAPHKAEQQARVYAAILAAGNEGRTWDEISAELDLAYTANGRITELRDDGKILDSGRRRTTRRGSTATVWIAF